MISPIGIQELADAGCDVIVDDIGKCLPTALLFLHPDFAF